MNSSIHAQPLAAPIPRSDGKTDSCRTGFRRIAKWFRDHPDLVLILALIVFLNRHLVGIGTGLPAIFTPEGATSGEWWRLFNHPFVHVSWYHLTLDAGGFLLLYTGLAETRICTKAMLCAVCAATSLAAAMLFSPALEAAGLCGLSGIAHGLMAFQGIEMMGDPRDRRVGLASLLIVSGKGFYELLTGRVLFDFLHFGMYGTPLAACHFGGVVGGVLAGVAVWMWKR
jgi:rhomboid family GlyGly-CTERM serine protease